MNTDVYSKSKELGSIKLIKKLDADPLEIIPNVELSFSNVSYVICVLMSFGIIAYGLAIYFATFRNDMISEIANVIYVDCNRFPVNNHRSEYHCVVGIEYPTSPGSTKMIQNSLTFIDSEKFFEGDQIEILVNKYNPLNIELRAISDMHLSIIYCFCGLILLIIVTGIRFNKII